MAAERLSPRSRERLLAYFGGAAFALLVAVAALLWLREGTAIYLARIISELPNCL